MFQLIAGPCVIESEEMVMEIASKMKQITERLGIPYTFKASFDKANRTSIHGKRGPGLEEGLRILQKVKDTYHLPVATDIHEPWQAEPVGKICDIVQIPAFLCRQTDLLVAAAKTGKCVNIKKAQFLAPWDMANCAQKVAESGNQHILLCERGTSFGYNNLVVDMTGLVEMKKLGYPVIFDATHSVQKPGGKGNSTGGNREELKARIDEGVQYTKDLGMYVIIDWHILRDRDPREHEEEAIKFFDEMSKKYADETHVLYEICNEPQNSPFKSVIKPYAENVIRTIRANDPDAVILVGTNTWSQDIDEVIGNEIDDQNVMYTLHFYAATHKEGLRQKLRKALDAGIPVYISECSIVDASGNGSIDSDSARTWMELINRYQLSYNAWSLCNKNESSALIDPSCSKYSGWSEGELSETGKWFRNEIRGEF